MNRLPALGLSAVAAGAFGYYCLDSRAAVHELITMPLLRTIYQDDAEEAHRLSIRLLQSGWHPIDRQNGRDPSCLRVNVSSLPF